MNYAKELSKTEEEKKEEHFRQLSMIIRVMDNYYNGTEYFSALRGLKNVQKS